MNRYEFTIMNRDIPIMHVVMDLESDYILTERLTALPIVTKVKIYITVKWRCQKKIKAYGTK